MADKSNSSVSERIIKIRDSMENAIAQYHGLAMPEKYLFTEETELAVTRTGLVYQDDKRGLDRDEVVAKIKAMKDNAMKHGMTALFKDDGHVETNKYKDETTDHMYSAENSSWCTSSTKRSVAKCHSFELMRYRSKNVIESVEGVSDISKIESVVDSKKAEAAFSILDELSRKYTPPEYFETTMITYCTPMEIMQSRKKRTPNTIKLFGLSEESVYSEMENLAKEVLEEKLLRISGSNIAGMPLIGKLYERTGYYMAAESYKDTIGKIGTIKKQFISNPQQEHPTVDKRKSLIRL